MGFPVTIALVARAVPMRGGSSAAAAGGNTPSATSGSPNTADCSAKMKSHASAISNPPPRQRPRTSAAVDDRQIEQRVDQRVRLRQHAADLARARARECWRRS